MFDELAEEEIQVRIIKSFESNLSCFKIANCITVIVNLLNVLNGFEKLDGIQSVEDLKAVTR
jgi:hypothetical protein